MLISHSAPYVAFEKLLISHSALHVAFDILFSHSALHSVGNWRGKSQSIIGKVKPIDYQLYNRISHNWHQIINHYSILCALCFYIIKNATAYNSITRVI